MIDYSPYKIQPGEDLYSYLARMQKEREGGILGTKGLLDVKKIDPEEEKTLGQAEMSCPVGQVWNGVACVAVGGDSDGEGVKSQYERYLESDERAAGFSFEDYKMQNSLDRLTGRKYAGQGLLYGIPNMLSTYSDKAEVKSQLLANGYTEEQADRMVNDPELASATNMLGRLGTMPTNEYDYKQQNTQDSLWDVGKSVIGSIFGMDKPDENYSRQSPFMTPDQYNKQGYKGLPALEAAKTAQIVEAQGRKMFDPLNQFNMDSIVKQAQQMAAQEKAAQEAAQAANIAAAQAANDRYLGSADSGSSVGFSSDGSTYTSSYGGSYSTSGMSDSTKAGLSIASSDTNNDGSFGD